MIKSSDINILLKSVSLKKKYIEKLKSKNFTLLDVKKNNYKILNSMFFKNNNITNLDCLVMYIIDISYYRTNTLLHVMDAAGKLKFFCSAGFFKYKGKSKKARLLVFKDIYNILLNKLKFLKNKPVALHLKNVGLNKFWLIKKLKKKFFIKTVKSFSLYPYNGCRKKKIRRKKIKKKMKKWSSGLRRQTVNLLSFSS